MKAMRTSLRILAGILLLCLLSCDRYSHEVLGPEVPSYPPLPAEWKSLLTRGAWQIQAIDGEDVSESLSRVREVIETHVWKEVEAVECLEKTFTLSPQGEWSLSLAYQIRLGLSGYLEDGVYVDVTFSVTGRYREHLNSGSDEMFLIFESKEHNTKIVHGYVEGWSCPPTVFPEAPAVCPAESIPPFDTEDLDWSVFDAKEKPLSKFFSSALLTADTETPVMYLPVIYASDLFALEGVPLFSQEQRDEISFTRTEEGYFTPDAP